MTSQVLCLSILENNSNIRNLNSRVFHFVLFDSNACSAKEFAVCFFDIATCCTLLIHRCNCVKCQGRIVRSYRTRILHARRFGIYTAPNSQENDAESEDLHSSTRINGSCNTNTLIDHDNAQFPEMLSSEHSTDNESSYEGSVSQTDESEDFDSSVDDRIADNSSDSDHSFIDNDNGDNDNDSDDLTLYFGPSGIVEHLFFLYHLIFFWKEMKKQQASSSHPFNWNRLF